MNQEKCGRDSNNRLGRPVKGPSVSVSCAFRPLASLNSLIERGDWQLVEVVHDIAPEDDIDEVDLNGLDDAKRRLRYLARLDPVLDATERARAWMATKRVLGGLMDGGWRVYAGEHVRRDALVIAISRRVAPDLTIDIPWEPDPGMRICRALDDLFRCSPHKLR